MSGTLLYIRQFIRLPDNRVIPVCLTGAERFTKRDRPTRRWDILALSKNDPNIAIKPAELVEKAGAYCIERQSVTYKGEVLSTDSLLHLTEEGIREAKTLEELRVFFPRVRLRCHLTVWANTGAYSATGQYLRESHIEGKCTVTTSSALREFVEMAGRRINGRAEDETVAVTIGFATHHSLYRILCAEMDGMDASKLGFYIVETSAPGVYAGRMDRSGSLRLEHSVHDARQFRTEPDAIDWLERHGRFFRQLSAAKVCFIPQKPGQGKNWLIQVNDSDQYIKRITRGTPILTDDTAAAMRFSSSNAANRWVKKYIIHLVSAELTSFSYVKAEVEQQETAA